MPIEVDQCIVHPVEPLLLVEEVGESRHRQLLRELGGAEQGVQEG